MRRFGLLRGLVTAFDVVVLAWMTRVAGLPAAAADVLSIASAASLSYLLTRRSARADDPYARWTREFRPFAGATLAAGALDVAVVALLTRPGAGLTTRRVVRVKCVSLLVAAVLRLALFRRVMFVRVRGEQARPVGRPPAEGGPRLSVVLPAYKEGERIGDTVRELRSALAPVAADGGLELVVVDDGSGDGTAEAARAAGADQVIVQPRNRGKGAAVRAGALAATGRTIAFTDADLAYSPEQILRLLDHVEQGWDVVVGSRKHVDTTTLVQARRLRELSGRVFNALTFAVLLGQYRDTQCGLKAFRADVARSLFSQSRIDGFAFDVELFHLAERQRLSLMEVPVELTNSRHSTVRLGNDASSMVRDLFRVRRLGRQGAYGAGASGTQVPAEHN